MIFWPLTLLVALAPIVFGTVALASYGAVGLAVAGLAILAGVRLAIGSDLAKNGGALTELLPIAGLFLAGLLASYLQFVLWPPNWLADLGLLGLDGEALVAPDVAAAESQAQLRGIGRLLTLALVFLLATLSLREPGRARRAMTVLLVATLAYGLYGIGLKFLGIEYVLGHEKEAYRGFVTSTFINRNTYANFAGLGLLVALAPLLADLTQGLEGRIGWKRKLSRTLELVLRDRLLALLTALVALVALFMTGSRGGLLSTFFAVLVLSLALVARASERPERAALVAGGVLATLVVLLVASGDAVLGRLADDTLSSESRLIIYEHVLALLEASGWRGVGYAEFPHAIAALRDERLPPRDVFLAHSSYLGLLLSHGLVAGLLILASLAALALALLRGLLRRVRGASYPALGLAALALEGLHSTIDFSLEIFGAALWFAFVLGLAYAQCRPLPERRGRSGLSSTAGGDAP